MKKTLFILTAFSVLSACTPKKAEAPAAPAPPAAEVPAADAGAATADAGK